VRAPAFVYSIRFWLTTCALVRLAALFIMPVQKDIFLNRAPFILHEGTSRESASYFPFLQNRTVFHPMTEDEHCYEEMAGNIVAGRGFLTDSPWVITTPGQPAMYGGCGYPLFVAAIYAVFGNHRELPVFLFQVALQTAALWFAFQTAAVLGGQLASVITAGFFTFHPVLIWISVTMLAEAILVPAMAALLWIVVCKPINVRMTLMTGTLLGVMALTRSTTGALVWLIVGWILCNNPHAFKTAAILVGIFVMVCAPWTIRNYVHWHRFIPFSTKSGVNAWFFNHPGLRVEFGRAAVEGHQPVDIFDPQIQNLPDEAARNDRLMAMFKDFVREQPGKFLGLCWIRFWMAILPARITSTSAGALVSAWYAKGIPLIVCMMTVIGILARRATPRFRRGVVFVLLLAAYWQAIQSLAGPGLRYRLPVEPAWAVIVGIAVACMVDMLKERAQPGEIASKATR
jgi:hypothetical protein